MARGHKMERENYIERLKSLTASKGMLSKIPKKEKLPSLAIDTELDKGTQTNRGHWIDETSLPAHHRSLVPASLDTSDVAKKQVSLIGIVDIQQRDLIPDGRGGYFVHITSKEIERIPRRNGNTTHRYENNHQRQHMINTRTNRPMRMARPQPHNQNRPHQRHFVDCARGGHPPPYRNQLPIGGNNMAEELLRMQHMYQPQMLQQNWRNNNDLPY